MSRYGFSNSWTLSPFSSQDGVPHVTEQDYSYITSADLEDHGIDIPRPYASQPSYDDYSQSAPSSGFDHYQPEDDILHIKHQGVGYPEAFPAYSIGDGKLRVSDVRDRIQMILNLSDRQAKRLKLYYKGRKLKKNDLPIREYGVKNNSEILMVLEDQGYGGESSAESSLVGYEGRTSTATSPRVGRFSGWEGQPHSPRESGSNVGLEVPRDSNRRRANSMVRTHSPSGSAVSVASAPPSSPPVGIPGGPIERLNAIAAEFHKKYLPRCAEFIARPPQDEKKRGEEYLRLSETLLQHVLLKYDGVVDTDVERGAKQRRKELVIEVQGVMRQLDEANKMRAT
ncbi:hypothetical protein VTJ83DRAFT_3782 [Remersonia thermophila]|uniref:BAG domain-containing protein n=1 Tax=Remersonia thermophila TaxID=72144 RepID=A0ABR4DF20_9PEZI